MQAPRQAKNESDAVQTDIARTVTQKRTLADNRPEAAAQHRLIEIMRNSPRVLQRAPSDDIHSSPRMVAQRHQMNMLFRRAFQPQDDDAMPAVASLAPREGKADNAGLPDQLMSGIESLSGMRMDHVRVHYNSDKPAQLQAHAYAQGSEIHLGPGQERHLPHEAWHVVQQAQGRVVPTLQVKAGVVNDDPSLEKEADVMGDRAAQLKSHHTARNPMAEERMAGALAQPVAGFLHPAGGRPAIPGEQEYAVQSRGQIAQFHRSTGATQGAPMQRELAVQRVCDMSATPSGTGVIQRIVHLTATQYQARVSPDGNLTMEALVEYVKVVLKDDLAFAQIYADDTIMLTCPDNVQRGEQTAIKHYKKALNTQPVGGDIAPNVAAADGLAQIVNAITARVTIDHPAYNVPPIGAAPAGVAATIPTPNLNTRYSHAPSSGYEHGNLVPEAEPVKWSNEPDGQSKFARSAGAVLLDAPASQPRNVAKAVEDRTDIKVLSWDQAKQYLPRPLINLLFDVKSQLVAGASVIDERTPFEQSERKATADGPGTLRSWHEDSNGALPSNGVAGIRANQQPAAIPGASTVLHNHYAGTSRSGAGGAAGNAVAPLGFAEYTGAGVEHIHNIKVVLDYVTNRVYLTLSHYQYWGMVKFNGEYHFIPGESQDLNDAKSKIANDATTKAAGGAYTLMHPWMEILVP